MPVNDAVPAPSETPPAEYRECVGICLINAEGQIFVARRLDLGSNEAPPDAPPKPWQIPSNRIAYHFCVWPRYRPRHFLAAISAGRS